MAEYVDPRKYDRYRLYMPGAWDIAQVLTVAADFVEGEPVVYNTPAAAGDWEIGDCNYTKYREACAQAVGWFGG